MTTFTERDIEAYIDTLPQPAIVDVPAGQPIHVVYGGADRFDAGTIAKLGEIARRSFAEFAPNADSLTRIFGIGSNVSSEIYSQIKHRLETCPIEDYRVDFEDGLGHRTDADEDSIAVNAARETKVAMAEGVLSPYFGFRIRALGRPTARRAFRTLDLYLTELAGNGGRLPENFVVTLPKVTSPAEIELLVKALADLEAKLAIKDSPIRIEFLAEEPRSLVSSNGVSVLLAMIAAANGRCRGVHLGAYDLMSSIGILSSAQTLSHPICNYARRVMQLSSFGTGVWLADGATNIMPIARHRGNGLTDDQREENRAQIEFAWRTHYDNCVRAIDVGFAQGWDLHPAQIPARLVAEFASISRDKDAVFERLRSFTDNMTRSTVTGGQFDDAATVRGLVIFAKKALALGAITPENITDRLGDKSLTELEILVGK